MKINKFSKLERILLIFYDSMRGQAISVSELAQKYGLSKKTITRDINEIKNFLANNMEKVGNEMLRYSYKTKAYSMNLDGFLHSKEMFAVLKILVASRSLSKDDLKSIISKMKRFTSLKDKQILDKLLRKEMYHYQEVCCDYKSEDKTLIDNVWEIANAIDEQREITINYYRMDTLPLNT